MTADVREPKQWFPNSMCFLLGMWYEDRNTICFGGMNMYIDVDTVIYLYVVGQ